ncbi:MAG: ABC transporter ATP-binding protein [Parachlamydiaceae bacterium]|nr:ABC transporter ATP-binding protein [Parachlamydiaceae bacterium]
MDKIAPLLSIKDLNVHFISPQAMTHVVKGINFNVFRGETLAIVGESGCGKSVTAQAIMHLLDDDTTKVSGEIWFENVPVHLMNKKQLQALRGKKIGMIFQDPSTSLNPTMKIGSQISETIIHHQGYSRKLARKKALELLEKVGISDPAMRYNAYPFQMSGGMRQRVVIAIALACSPMLLIADEPTTALDVTVQAQILDLLKNICKSTDMSLLLITHDLGVVAGTCDRMAVMRSGEIVEQGSVDALFYKPTHPYTQTLMTAKYDKTFI